MRNKTPAGKDTWSQSTVRSILTNEKYKGDALLQKNFTVDFLTKKTKKNEGEVPQYYVENNYPAIINPETFELVQAEIARRTGSGVGIFASKIKCSECGSWYGSKVWHSNDKYRWVIYQCNHKYSGGKKCSTPHLNEDEIKAAFVKAYNIFLTERTEMIRNKELVIGRLSDTAELDARKKELEQEMAVLVEMIQNCIAEKARVAIDQDKYQERYNGLVDRYEEMKRKYDGICTEISYKTARAQILNRFLSSLQRGFVVEKFDEALWASLVDHITVEKDKRMVAI